MSFYATLQGSLTYPDLESFQAMVKELTDGGWLDSEGYILEETEDRVSPEGGPNASVESLSIDIPCWHYRNLSRINFFNKAGVRGYIVGTSTDGCFSGWFIEDGVEENYDLTVWASENLEGDDRTEPNRAEYDDDDDYQENLNEWQGLVEREFIEEMTG